MFFTYFCDVAWMAMIPQNILTLITTSFEEISKIVEN
jgi:hypothetical protein